MQGIQLRSETRGDEEAIAAVTRAAFEKAEHSSGTESLIVSELRRSGALTISLVALQGDRMIGHVAVSPVSISDGADGWFGLGPISVHPDSQGRGVGSVLMSRALDELRQRGAGGCVLLGEPGFYSRFGFRADSQLTLPGVPAEYFQALHFRGPMPGGAVGYHPAFQAGA